MCSEVEPKGGVGDDTSEGQASPHHFISSVSFVRDSESLQFGLFGDSGKHLTALSVEVNHVNHYLGCLLLVRGLHEEAQLFWLHISELHNSWAVGLRVLGSGIALVENTLDGSHGLSVQVHALVLQIVRDPASVDKDGLLFAGSIQVCVEWGNNIDSLLATAHLLDLDFTSVVEDSTHLHGFH